MFDMTIFAGSKIAIIFDCEEEFNRFCEELEENWPNYYMHNVWGPTYTYCIGYQGHMHLMHASNPKPLANQGYEIMTFKELCSLCSEYDSLEPITNLYE